MSEDNQLLEDNPDTILIESSVPEVRALEQKTRTDIETQKKELRSMVGEQYHELISAADAIITMSKNAQAIHSNFERMQKSCNVETIKKNAQEILKKQSEENNQTHIDTKRKYVYIIAALVKSLADVPEQIWHALENHRYLHACRLFTLSKQVHEYLEVEKTKSTIDIEVAFPVIQRQWDAVSAFGPQIVQKSIHYFRVSEQSSEHIAEIIVGLMLLDHLSFGDSIDTFLEMRTNLISDVIYNYNKTADTIHHRVLHQLKEVTLIIKRTLQQVYDIFYCKENHSTTLIESYVTAFQKTFLIPSNNSHGNETPNQPAITRLFSPSSNVHLIVRYLPEELQNYMPLLDSAAVLKADEIKESIQKWLTKVESIVKEELPKTLKPVETHVEILQIRTKLWELLDEDENTKDRHNVWQKASQALLGKTCSLWDSLYRDLFNNHSKLIIDQNLLALSKQPKDVVWHQIMDTSKPQTLKKNVTLTMNTWAGINSKTQSAFSLPSFSSTKEISNFKSSLTETANDRTDILCKLQSTFDTLLCIIRKDMQAYLVPSEHSNFHVKDDTAMIKTYFQENCYTSLLTYSSNLKSIIDEISNWTNNKTKNELCIFLGRLSRNIALLSKELPKALAMSTETLPVFELKSSIDKDPQYTKVQNTFLDAFHYSHTTWIIWLKKEFSQKLKLVLSTTKWNDQCPALSVWENIEEDVRLPTQTTNSLVRALFFVCEEMQCINSAVLDQHIMRELRQHLYDGATDVFDTFLQKIESLDITENGSLQLLFDFMFLNLVFQNVEKSTGSNNILEKLQDQIDPINWASYEAHMKPCVNKFYIKQSLIFGVLTSATNETYERAKKVMSSQKQGQHNVLPLASQATRFTLLPIGYLNSSSLRAK